LQILHLTCFRKLNTSVGAGVKAVGTEAGDAFSLLSVALSYPMPKLCLNFMHVST
jgi:hypothetical protein